jgi:hypothetical protein
MAASNVVVDYVVGLSPLVNAAFGPRATGAKVTVRLLGGGTCQIDPRAPNAANFARMLDMLRHAGKPAYIKTAPGTGVVTRVPAPLRR